MWGSKLKDRDWPALIRRGLLQVLRLVAVGVLFGWFYAWAAPKFYPKTTPSHFGHGLLHGALMPMALPSLVIGKDVDIYASENTGRPYKLGYIAGINVCGFLFFGLAFAKPRSQPPDRLAPKSESDGPGAAPPQ